MTRQLAEKAKLQEGGRSSLPPGICGRHVEGGNASAPMLHPGSIWPVGPRMHIATGALMRDIVRYRLHAGWLGTLAAGRKVAAYVARIFDYRARKIDEMFGR